MAVSSINGTEMGKLMGLLQQTSWLLMLPVLFISGLLPSSFNLNCIGTAMTHLEQDTHAT